MKEKNDQHIEETKAIMRKMLEDGATAKEFGEYIDYLINLNEIYLKEILEMNMALQFEIMDNLNKKIKYKQSYEYTEEIK